MDELDNISREEKSTILSAIINDPDLNLKSILYQLIEKGYAMTFKVIFEKFIKHHRGFKTAKDLEAMEMM